MHGWINFESNGYMFISYISLCMQLQLQRNEVIALINLLNRLSESVKFVHQTGPSIKNIVRGGWIVDPPIQAIGIWQKDHGGCWRLGWGISPCIQDIVFVIYTSIVSCSRREQAWGLICESYLQVWEAYNYKCKLIPQSSNTNFGSSAKHISHTDSLTM